MIIIAIILSILCYPVIGFSAPGIVPPESFIAERWYPSNLPTVMPPWKIPGADISHFRTARPHQSPGTTTTSLPPTNSLPMPPGSIPPNDNQSISSEPHPPAPHVTTVIIQTSTNIPVEEESNTVTATINESMVVTAVNLKGKQSSQEIDNNSLRVLSPNFEDITKVGFENESEFSQIPLANPNNENQQLEEGSGEEVELLNEIPKSTPELKDMINSTTSLPVSSTTQVVFGAIKNDSNMDTTITTTDMVTVKTSTVTMEPSTSTTAEIPITTAFIEISDIITKNQLRSKGKKECKDIIFLLDSSGNVVKQYEKQKQYIEEIVRELETSSHRRYGLITFAGRTRQKIVSSLPDESNGAQFILKLRKARFLRGVTATGAAISVTTQYVLQKGRGVQVVVVTDGFSFDDVQQQAEALRSIDGVETYATGRYFPVVKNVLLSIGGGEDHVFFDKNEEKLIDKLQC